ncbi:MAG TPA: tetratricopeptide repeat protein [Candidatus Tripitaka californicus]|uniref:tetratricopeptide repeat protein n=1 Tax=Candidatus Tripitaka californicus TaxID=3367616 RepID=UPI004024C2A7
MSLKGLKFTPGGLLLLLLCLSCGGPHPTKLEEDITMYKRILRALPEDVDTHYRLGLAYYEDKDYEAAIKELKTAIKESPTIPILYNQLGLAYQADDEPRDAIEEYQKALALEPEFFPARVNLGVVYYLQKRFTDAAGEFTQVLQKAPDHAGAHLGLGLAYVQMDKYEEAVSHFQEAIRLNPQDSEGYKQLGIVYKLQGKKDEALANLKTAVTLNPNDGEASWYLAGLYMERGKVDEAIMYYTYVTDSMGGMPMAHYEEGMAFRKKGALLEALAEFERAEKEDPRYPGLQAQLASIYHELNKLDEAVEHYEKALKYASGVQEAELRRGLGNAYTQQWKFKKAIEQYNKALAIEPENAQTHKEIAEAYAFNRDIPAALPHWRKAAELSPNLAKDIWERALDFDYSIAEAHYALGLIYEKQGKMDKALNSLTQAVKLSPQDKDYQSALERIKKQVDSKQ